MSRKLICGRTYQMIVHVMELSTVIDIPLIVDCVENASNVSIPLRRRQKGQVFNIKVLKVNFELFFYFFCLKF